MSESAKGGKILKHSCSLCVCVLYGSCFTEAVSKGHSEVSTFRGPEKKGVNMTLPTMILKKNKKNP